MNIIISGASSGIGLYLSKAFSNSNDNKIFLITSKKKTKNDLIKKIYNKNIKIVSCDYSNSKNIIHIIPSIEKFFKKKKINLLINNAGTLGEISKFTECNYKNWTNSININFFSHVFLIKKIFKFINSTNGCIINITGGGAQKATKYQSAYSVSKTAMARFTENLALDLKDSGINCYGVAPGILNTNIHNNYIIKLKKFKEKNELNKILKLLKNNENSFQKVWNCISKIYKHKPRHLSGKIISAQFDNIDKLIKSKNISNDLFKLRRIDNFLFFPKNII
jgi:short-subunit dehydrogenase